MSSHSLQQSIITEKSFKVILIGLVLIVAVLAGVKYFGLAQDDNSLKTPALQSMMLHVEDQTGGMVRVSNAANGEEIALYKTAEGGFVRAVLRAMVNNRRKKGVDDKGDFLLERHVADQYYLIDEVTGLRLSLNAYGPTNAAVFAAFLSTQKGEVK